jgi:lipopolysaccharide/colanic/teichoic acid biosynthesis glycosyltransferase
LKNVVNILFNRTLALTAILVLSPVMLALYVLVYFKMGSPVLFKQVRPGRNGKPFLLIKFRTMLADESLPEAQRVTRLGHFMRNSSLDELPEFWNVLKGEMNLVGPRPLLMDYLPLYNEEQKRRHDVLPGITGHAQVNGRNAISWEEKFKLDIWYVENQSLALDIKILFQTVKKVFFREGVNHSQDASMTKFQGTKKEAA